MLESIIQSLSAVGIECQQHGYGYVVNEYQIGLYNHQEFELVSGGYLLFSTYDPSEFVSVLVRMFS
jgi:hypothetical protein